MGFLAVSLMLLSLVSLVFVAYRNFVTDQQLLPHESRLMNPWGLVDLLLVLFIAFASTVGCQLFVSYHFGLPLDIDTDQLDGRQQVVLLGSFSVASLLSAAFAMTVICKRTIANLRSLGFDFKCFASDLRLGAVAFVLLFAPVFGIQLVLTNTFPTQHPLVELLRSNPEPMFFVVGGFAAIVAAPVVEEFFFRVLFQGWMENVAMLSRQSSSPLWQNVTSPLAIMGLARCDALSPSVESSNIEQASLSESVRQAEHQQDFPSVTCDRISDSIESPAQAPGLDRPAWWPILVSSLFFALAHLSHGPDLVALFVLAMGLGYLYQRTHRIIPCIVIHFLVNSLSMVQLWFLVH